MWYMYKTVIDSTGKIDKKLLGTYGSFTEVPDEIMQEVDYAMEDKSDDTAEDQSHD